MIGDAEHKIVILLTIDCLRKDHLKIYGYYRNSMPNLEKLAKQGIVYSNAFSNGPETPTSFSSIFTSILPNLNGGFCPLPNQKITFPQILKRNGIFTYAVHSNAYLGEFFNYSRGFDVFIDGKEFFLESQVFKDKEKAQVKKFNNQKSPKRRLSIFFWNKLIKNKISKILNSLTILIKIKNLMLNIDFLRSYFLQIDLKGFSASIIVKKLINFIDNYSFEQPCFIWAHFMDAHNPYNPPTKNLLKFSKENINSVERKFLNYDFFFNYQNYKFNPKVLEKLISLYDAELNYIDECLAKLFSFLKKKIDKNCLIIITADHGESFYEHYTLGHQGHLFDELLKVPLLIIELRKEPKFKRVEELVQLIDIAPTILEYFNIKKPDSFLGSSLFPLLNYEKVDHSKYIISESYQKKGYFKRNSKEGYKLFSIRTLDWKYIFNEEENKEYLFNLKNDPYERTNLINKKNEVIKKFLRIKNEHFKKIKFSDETSKISFAIKNLNLK